MSYKIHHINCGTMCAGDTPLLRPIMPKFMSCHCLVVETNNGLTLIDTGFGIEEVRRPALLGQLFLLSSRPVLKEEETALRQIEKMHYQAIDVTDIIVTHLHLDHAGGISDFPNARVHVHKPEYDVAQHPKGLLQEGGYLKHQWRDAKWNVLSETGEKWFGFESVRPFEGNDNILLIPLPGHSPGHCGVAVNSTDGWVLHCGDAYFSQSEITTEKGTQPFGLKVYQSLMQDNKALRLSNRARLRELYREKKSEIQLICSHDYDDFCNCSTKNLV